MGPTRMRLGKPVIAAIEGHAVAGGLELALWCDLRVAARDAVLGVFNRRFGVPLIDLGTVRLPRLIGQSRALDLILTGRAVPAEEAFSMGLVNRLAEPGEALAGALELAHQLAAFPAGRPSQRPPLGDRAVGTGGGGGDAQRVPPRPRDSRVGRGRRGRRALRRRRGAAWRGRPVRGCRRRCSRGSTWSSTATTPSGRTTSSSRTLRRRSSTSSTTRA